jgi:steroid 5-alpha reductase family enzyme/predicted DCC family thiol-disulfide oxidoreductase YuxK
METFLLNLAKGNFFFISALSVIIYVSIWGLIFCRKKRADIADIAWGPGFMLLAWVSFILNPFSYYSLSLDILISIWALRLAAHIYLRNRNNKEDFRYDNLKIRLGQKNSLRMFFKVFLLQGMILYIVALPIMWIHSHAKDLSISFFMIALPLWLIGFFVEILSDYQLVSFKKKLQNKGKLLQTGLWKYVRHPNYLGEILIWWAIWLMTVPLPYGWIFIISPALMTFLIVKVSGIAPLEEKMKNYPGFREYAQKTPVLIPFSILNGAINVIAWLILVFYGSKRNFVIPFFVSLFAYATQIYLYFKTRPQFFVISILLSIYAFLLGLIQETVFIGCGLLDYNKQGFLAPYWLIALYPLFSLTLNSSLSFLNRNLWITFCIGGAGSLLSYLSGQSLGAVHLNTPSAYFWLFLSWGLYLTILILINRKLMALGELYSDKQKLKKPLTVFFDAECPVCYREMVKLKSRRQTGCITYACPRSDQELKKITHAFSYKQAMKKIHALDENGKIMTGIDVLAAAYARTDLTFLAIALQAPGFRTLFKMAYSVWAKFRSHIFVIKKIKSDETWKK